MVNRRIAKLHEELQKITNSKEDIRESINEQGVEVDKQVPLKEYGDGVRRIDRGGGGDMYKSVYDKNDNGIVDDAEKVNGHTVDSDVPANAEFTDTVYDDTELRGLIEGKQDELKSGENIKTLNGESILGEGDIEILADAVLKNDLVVNNPMGRYSDGDVIEKDTDLEEIFRKILTKLYYPSLIDPSTSISTSVPQLAEVGKNVGGNNVYVNFDRGSIYPQYTAESPYRSGETENYTIRLNNISKVNDTPTTTWTNTNDTGTFKIPTFTRNTPRNS